MSDLIRQERQGGVLRIVLNDDATRNSLSEGMMAALAQAIDKAGQDQTIGAVVLASTGKVFSSGHNLKELNARRADPDKGLAYFEQVFNSCARLMTQIAYHRCAFIAEVDGLASAAGCQLVATCDLAYASPRASFCTPGVNIGLFCSTPMVALTRAAAPRQAMEMLLLGAVHDAEYAARAGLINAVVPQNELSSHVLAVAQTIATKSQAAISFGKRLFHEQRGLPLDEAYALAAGVMVKNMLNGAACEGLDAFIHKRQPNWPALNT